MSDILFSTWAEDVIDNRGGPQTDVAGLEQAKWPEKLKEDKPIKAFMGWDGFVLHSEDVQVVDLCRAYMEAVRDQSCGKCIPCQSGTTVMARILANMCQGQGKPSDITYLREVAQTVTQTAKCGVGKTGPLPIIKALDHFPEQFADAVQNKVPLEPRFQEALDIIRTRLPIPGIVGRVCVRPCEEHCRRANLDDPVSIKYLKRFVADEELCHHKQPVYEIKPSEKTGKVAIVGAGPAGVTCAFHLAKMGHAVSVYEHLSEPGGMSAVGIPDYRLPRHILRGEVAEIEKLGVAIKYNTTIGKDITLSQLEEDFDAVFIGIGAQNSSPMRVEGEDKGYKGFIPGVKYLLDINEGRDPYPEGKRVVVIGGGNVAIDCVRSSFRINKEDVNLVYRRTRNEMPADEVEIVDAEEEQVQFHFLTTPVRIIEEDGVVVGLECIRMKLGKPDASGRRRPVPIKGSEFTFDCDTVVPAIGQRVDLSLLAGVDGIETTAWMTFIVDDVTKQTSRPKIFAAGDCETGPDALITACAGGRKAAESIDRMINGLPLEYKTSDCFHKYFKDVKVYDQDEDLGELGKEKRKHLDMLAPDVRKTTFDEVEQGFTIPEAIKEAKRCFRCYRIAIVAT